MLSRIKNPFLLFAAFVLSAALPARAAIAPSAVTDLAVAAVVSTGIASSSMTVTLSWTAPGEEGSTGTLFTSTFSIRWSSSTPITNDAEFDAANFALDIATTGVDPGALQTVEIPGLDTSATHYFVIKTTDTEFLTSPLSNAATGRFAITILLYPAVGAFVNVSTFRWTGPSTTTIADMAGEYFLEVSDSDADFAPGNIVIFISTPAVVLDAGLPANQAGYVSTTTLVEGNTHYWRVRVRDAGGNFAAWSATGSFVTDATTPAESLFRVFTSSGGGMVESQIIDLVAGVTAQITVQDLNAGLNFISELSTENAVALYHFDERDGISPIDATGNGNTGTMTCNGVCFTSPTYRLGLVGSAMSMDSTAFEYMSAPNTNFDFAAISDFTVEAWIKPNTISGDRVIAGVGAGISAGGNWVFKMTNPPGSLAFKNNGANSISPPDIVTANEWQHVALVVRNVTHKFYVNGAFAGEGNFQSIGNTGGPSGMPFTIGVGVRADGVGEGFFDGMIDELVVRSFAATPEQIAADYEATKGGRFVVEYSTTAGNDWNVVSATYASGGLPYVALTGAPGSISPEVLSVHELSLRSSTSSATGSGATNQVRFGIIDRGGNQLIAGPYSILVDTIAATMLSTPTYPANGAYVGVQPNFNWDGPSTAAVAQAGNVLFILQVDDDNNFASPEISISTPAVTASTQAAILQGAYISTTTLADDTTFYWRVMTPGNIGVFSPIVQIHSFVTDLAAPVASGFFSRNIANVVVAEDLANNLIGGVTVEMTIQDAGPSGLSLSPPDGLNSFGVMYTTMGAAGLPEWVEGFWAETFSDPAQTEILALAEFQGLLVAGTESGTGRVYQYNGVNWAEMAGSPLAGTQVRALHEFQGQLYAGLDSANGEIFLYNGVAWAQTFQTGRAMRTNDFATFGGRLYAATNDSGRVWVYDPLTNGWSVAFDSPDAELHSLAVYNGRLFIGGDTNLFEFDGSVWAVFQNLGADIYDLAVYNGRLYAATGDAGRVYRSDGSNWVVSFTPAESEARSLGVHDGRLYAGIGAPSNGRVYVHDGNGDDWMLVRTLGNSSDRINAFQHFAGRLYIGTDIQTINGVVYVSTPISLGLSGDHGTTAAETAAVQTALTVLSANANTCGGFSPCAGTNQMRITVSDIAGNVGPSGPYAILVDPLLAAPTAAVPTDFTFVRFSSAVFSWNGPTTNPNHSVQVSSVSTFADLSVDKTGGGLTIQSDPGSLSHDTTYYWRVRAQNGVGIFSLFSDTASFWTDLQFPALSSFMHYNSTGGMLSEVQINNLMTGVTVQMTATDSGGGLDFKGAAAGSPLGYWPFEIGAGDTMFDASGNALNGTMIPAASRVPAYRLAGVQSSAANYVHISSPTSASWPGMSVMAWARSNVVAGNYVLWATNQVRFETFDSGGRMRFQATPSGAGCTAATAARYVNGEWNHVAYVVDAGANENRIYVNGTLAASCSPAMTPAESPIRFGGDGISGGAIDGWVGTLDEFRVYNRTVADAEVSEDFASARFWVAYTNDAGALWTFVGSTTPGAGEFLSVNGPSGSLGPLEVKAQNLSFNTSASTLACSGVGPCAATNQVVFCVPDKGGNLRTAGPFAVVVDTYVPQPLITLAESQGETDIFVVTLGSDNLAGVQDYLFEASTSAAFAQPITSSSFIAIDSFTFNGLMAITTYYLRVSVRDILGSVSVFSPIVSTMTQGTAVYSTATAVPSNILQDGTASMLRFDLRTNQGAAKFNGIRVTRTGTANDVDIPQAHIVADDGNGVYISTEDVVLGSGFFTGGITDILLASPASFDSQSSTFFVVFQADPGATVGNTVGLLLEVSSHVFVQAPVFPQGPAPTTVAPISIVEGANTLSFTAVDLVSPTGIAPGTLNAPILRINSVADQGSSEIDEIVVHIFGTLGLNQIQRVNVWRDANANGIFEAGQDDLLSSGTDNFIPNGVSTISLVGAPVSSRTVTTVGERFFITVDLSGTAPQNDTFQLRVATPTSVHLSNPFDLIAFSPVPLESSTATVTIANTISVTPEDRVPAAFVQGGVFEVLKATLTVDAGFAAINRIQVDRLGIGVDADVSAVEIWRDALVDGSPFNEVTDVFLGSGTFTSAQATIDIATMTLDAGTTGVLFVIYRVNPGANPGNSLGASMTNNNYFRAVDPLTTIEGPFAIQTSTADITATINQMLIPTVLAVNPGTLQQGAVNVPMLRIDGLSDLNNFNWLSLTIDRLGSGADGDVANLAVFLDDGDQTFNGADVLITAGDDIFAGGSSAMALTSAQTMTASTKTYFVTMSIAPTAAPGITLGLRVPTTAAFNISAPNFVSTQTASFPADAGPVSVVQAANSVSVTTTSIAPPGAQPGTQDVGMMDLVLQTDISNADWLSLRVEEIGSTADAEIDAVKVYFDLNELGVWDASNLGQYQLVSSSTQSFSGSFVTLAFSTPPVISPAAKRFFVTVDLSTNAVPGRTVVLRAIDETSFGVNAPNSLAPVNYVSQTLSVDAPPEQMFMLALDSAPASAVQGAANQTMLTLRLWMSNFTGAWTGLTVERTGTGLDSDVPTAKLFRDDNGNGMLDVLTDARLATATFSGSQTNFSFSTQTLTVSTQTFFVTYDVSVTAPQGNTLGARLSAPGAFTIATPNSVNSTGFPSQSTDMSVSATQTGLFVLPIDQTPLQLVQGAMNQVMMSLSVNTTQFAASWSGLVVRSTGTASDSDIALVRVWRDVNTNNVVDPGIDEDISSGGSTFLNGTAVVSLSPVQTIGTSVGSYLLTVDVAAFADGTKNFGTVIESTASFTLNAPNFVVNQNLPSSSFIVDIAKQPEQLVLAASDLGLPGIHQGSELAVAKLIAQASRDQVIWTLLRINKAGSLSDSEIVAARLYRDSDGSGAFSAGDLLIASAPFSSAQASLSFSSAQTVGITTAAYFVTLEASATASVGATLGFSIPDETFLTVLAPDSVSSAGLPFTAAATPILDANTPTQPVVTTDGPFSSSFESIHFTWNSSVQVGSIVGAEYAVGSSSGGTEFLGFTSIAASQTDFNAVGFPLTSGSTYFISVRAQSSGGFTSPAGTSIAVLVDFTEPPTPLPTITPGGSTVLVAWPTVTAGPSGILGYLIEYRIGGSPTWFNAKTGAKSAAMAVQSSGGQSLTVAALSANDVVSGNSFVAGGLPNGTVYMRMSAVTGAGIASPSSDPIKLQLGPLPDEGISDASNYPNPFDSRQRATTFHYALSRNADVSIKIFSVFGRLVKETGFAAGTEGGRLGSNNVQWDGTDFSGTKVSKGIYLVVIESGGAKEVLRVGVIH